MAQLFSTGSLSLDMTAVPLNDLSGGYVTFAEELASANTHGETLDEAGENPLGAVALT